MIYNSLKRSRFLKQVLTLLTGTAIAQVIPLAASPVLTRIYNPENFGVFGLYFSIISILAIFATCRYELAIVVVDKEEEALSLFYLAVGISILASILSPFLFFFLRSQYSFFHLNPDILQVVNFFPLSILIVGVYNSIDNLSIRYEKFKLISISRILRNLVYVAFAILLGFYSISINSLVISHILGIFSATLILFLCLFDKLKSNVKIDKRMFFVSVVNVFRKYVNYPKFMIPARFAEVFSSESPTLMITMFFGLEAAGFYALSKRVIQLPVSLISRATGDVFKKRATDEYQKYGSCTKLFDRTVFYLMLLATFPFFVLVFFAPLIFSKIFGSKWILSGDLAQLLAMMSFAQFITSPIGSIFILTNNQKWDLRIQLMLSMLVVLVITIGYYVFNDLKVTVMLISFVYVFKYSAEFYLARKFSKGKK